MTKVLLHCRNLLILAENLPTQGGLAKALRRLRWLYEALMEDLLLYRVRTITRPDSAGNDSSSG